MSHWNCPIFPLIVLAVCVTLSRVSSSSAQHSVDEDENVGGQLDGIDENFITERDREEVQQRQSRPTG